MAGRRTSGEAVRADPAAFRPEMPAGGERRTPRRAPAWVRGLFGLGTALSDAAVANAALLTAFLARFEGEIPGRNFEAYRALWPALTISLLSSYWLVGLYLRRREFARVELASMIARASLVWLFASFTCAYLLRDSAAAFPTAVFLLGAALNVPLSLGARAALEHLRTHYVDAAHRVRRAVVIGRTIEARRLLEAASTEARFEYAIAGVVDDRLRSGDRFAGFPVLGPTGELGRIVRDEAIEEVVLADPALEHADLLHCLVQCAGSDVRFRLVPDLLEIVRTRQRVKLVAGVPLVDLFGEDVPDAREMAKRAFDFSVSACAMTLALPFALAIAVAIRLTSRGPVFYAQDRVGHFGRTFRLWKFRTMRVDAEERSGPVLASVADPRVTSVGRLLRRTRLDELPQLANILAGQMSLVGPRPERPHFVGQFLKSVPEYGQRYRVRPGLTGLAQVEGEYDLSPRNKVRYDLIYIANRSLMLDLKILWKTVPVVLRGSGAR